MIETACLKADQDEELIVVIDSSQQAEENVGMPAVFTLVDVAKTWIQENVTERPAEAAEEEPEEVTTFLILITSSGVWSRPECPRFH